MLRVDPRQRDRLIAIIRNLRDRIGEAQMNGWMGEAAGLRTILHAATDELSRLQPSGVKTSNIADLGFPIIGSSTAESAGW
jgi:hypothetical protein